ncbi:MAG: hemagglutinin repeat-containing protein [Ottowia sp.]|nr:hemagglutinin repeat-containing protein [Ottowia sp.]
MIQSGEAADITINQFTHQGNTIALGERTTAVISFNTATSFFKDYILPVGKHGLFIFNPAVLDKKQMTERAGNVSPPLHLIQANPLFSHTSAPWSSVYLSNMLFANQTSKKLDWQKRLRLGDGHYEEKLIADQILAKTGRAWLSNGDTHFVDRATQFKQLMDNAVSHAHFAFGGDTDFYLGHMLTRAQEKQLSKDIVWLARHDMGAHPDILVPEVYLSPLTQSRLLGATLVAHKIDLNVTTLDNQGGAIEATQALYINASGAVINRSGKMQGETVNITAASLFNETVVHRYGELNNITDLAGKTAMITAKAGDISVQTKGDITQIGGHMHAAKKIDLQVGSKVQVTALALQMPSESTSHYETGLAQSKSVVVTTKQEKKLASELSGEGVVIRSQGNMVFVGADIKGTGKLESEHGNVTFQALSLLSAQRTETKISTLLMPKYEPNSTTALWKFGVENQSIVQTEVKKIFSPTSVAHDGFEVLAKNGDIDLGGGDYIASSESSKPVFKMSAKKIKPQKHVDTVTVDTKLITTFTGLQAEVHSSFAVIADDKKRNSENTEKLDQHMNALAAMDLASGSKAIRGDSAQYRETAIKLAQAAGAFSSFAFDDLLGTSLKISAETSTDEVTHQTKKERRNHIRAHHIIIQQTEGDLHLAGIDVAATPSGEISFEAPGAIHLSFAKSDETQTTTNIQNDLSIGLAASIDRRGAGASVDVDYHFVLGKGQATWHRPMVSVIAGDLVKIKSGGDTQLEGVKITADVFDADIGGAFRITSEQHTKTEQHTQAGTSVSLGVNVNTVSVYGVNGHLQPEGSAMWESAALTVIQSGITSKKMTGAVKGDLDLVGSHLLVTDPQKKEAFSVGGKVSGKKIHDTIDKNGFSGSFGAGITRTGMPTVSLEANPAEKIDYKAEQQATLNVVLTTTDGGPALVEGELNPDSTRLVNVTQAEYVERADIKFIVGDIDAHSKQPKKKSKQFQSEALVYAFAKLSADGKQVKKMVEETDSKKHTVTHDINKIKQTLSQVEVLKKQIDDATAQRDQDQSRLDEYASLLKNHDEKTMEDRYAARSAEYFRKTKEYRDLILLHLAEADVSYESGAWLESARQRAEHDSVMKTYYDEYIKFEYWHTAASTAYENDRENYRTEIDMLQKKIVTANDIIANDNKQVGVYRSDLKKDLINALTHKQRAVDNDALSQQKVEALERALNESISATTNDYKEQATQQVEQIKADAQASAAHINQMKNSLDGLDQQSIIRFLSEDTQPNAVHSTSPTLESWFADVFPHRPSDEKTRRVSTLVLVPQMLKDNMDQLVSEVYAHSEVDKPSQKLQTLFEHDAPTGLKNISDESQISTPSSSSDNDADQINTPRAKHVISPETKMFLSLNLLTTKLKRKNYDRAIKAYLGSLVPKLYSNKPGDPQILAAKVAYAQQMIDTVKRMLDEGKSNDDIKSFLKIDSTSTMPVPNQDISDLDTSRLDGGEDGFQ